MAKGHWIALGEAHGRRFSAYEAQAEPQASGAALLIFHDMFGITDPFRDLADEFAGQGHSVLVPNLFWRAEPDGVLPYDGGHERGWKRLETFDYDGAVADVATALGGLRLGSRAQKIVALGFCFSGVVSFLAASRLEIAAAASFYALGISRYAGEIARIKCPLQLHYGLDDASVPRAEIDAVAAAAKGNARIETYLYPGAGHSFFNPARPMYDRAASALASSRLSAMIERVS